jgi:hypothetical protein
MIFTPISTSLWKPASALAPQKNEPCHGIFFFTGSVCPSPQKQSESANHTDPKGYVILARRIEGRSRAHRHSILGGAKQRTNDSVEKEGRAEEGRTGGVGRCRWMMPSRLGGARRRGNGDGIMDGRRTSIVIVVVFGHTSPPTPRILLL